MPKKSVVLYSYHPRDAAIAARIAEEFRRSGVEIYDPITNSAAGSVRDSVVRAARSSVALVLVIMSPDYPGSGWSAYLAGMFSAMQKPVIVLASQNVPPSSIPADLAIQGVYTFDPDMPEAAVRRSLIAFSAAA